MNTRTLVSKALLTIGRLLVVCLFLLQATGVAHADVPVVEGDGVVTANNSTTLNFGENVCAGTTLFKSIEIGVNHVGGSKKNSFANSALVTINATVNGGAGLSISLPDNKKIQLPSNWDGLGNNVISSELITASVKLIASSTPGPFSGSITISGTGTNQDGTSVTRDMTLSVTATIVACDTTPPTISVPTDITVEATSSAGAEVTFSASAKDTAPAIPAVTCLPASGSIFPLGSTTVTCSATDAAGNSGSTTFKVTVRDTTAPGFSDVVIDPIEATGANGATVTFDAPVATDRVDGEIKSVTCSPASGSSFAIGSTNVTCTAADSRGNSGSTSFNIVVQDTTKPVLLLPVDITKEADSSAGAVVPYTVSASDVVDGTITPSCAPASGSIFSLGSTDVVCTAIDAHSNRADGSFSVNVVDTTPPALALPDSLSAEADGPLGAIINFTATAFDKVDGATEVSCNPASGATFSLGKTKVTCTSTDKGGNEAEGSFNITVVDTTAPELTVPADQKLEATGPAGAVATFSPSASDLVDGTVAPICTAASGSTFQLGITTITCTATDSSGNTAQGEFVIKVVDTTAPTLSLPTINKQEATSASGAAVEYTATASDLVDGPVAPVCSPVYGSIFPLGTSFVSCTATDKAGNPASGSFSVEVVDTTPPDISVTFTSPVEATGPDGAAVNFTASALDLVDGTTAVNCTPASGATFGLGDTSVTCTSTDAHSNTGTKTFNIAVQDTTPPVLSLPDPITAEATSPKGADVTYSPTATDLVDGSVPVTCDPVSGSTFALGTKTVGCEATDSHKNTARGTFRVKVQDTIAPTVHCDEPNGNWSGSDITVGCTASDSGSGLAKADDASFTLTTNVADGIETDSTTTDFRIVTDVVGNSTSAGPFEGLKVDKAVPTYSCGKADSIWHKADVSIACQAADGGSGLATPAEFSLSTHVNDGEEIANAVTDGAQVSDKVGHDVTVAPISGNMIDKKAPQLVSCDQPDGLWHADNVTLNCTYSDGGSGPATQTLSLSTTVAAGEETSSAKASTTQQAKDKVGNAAPIPDPISGNWIDRKAPVITIETPAGEYLLNQSVTVKFSCADSGSGVATCQGTQANGAALDTSTVGMHSIKVTSTDNVGNASEKTVSYNVIYADANTLCLGQAGHQVLQPINSDGSSVFKKGSTVPVKFRVCDANGNSVSTAGIVKSFTVTLVNGNVAEMVNEASFSTTPDTTFRWSATDQQWIYNLSTKDSRFSATTSGKYSFIITLNDGSNIKFYMGLK